MREVLTTLYCENTGHKGCRPGFCVFRPTKVKLLHSQFHQMDEAQEKCHRVRPWDQGVQKLGQINTRDLTGLFSFCLVEESKTILRFLVSNGQKNQLLRDSLCLNVSGTFHSPSRKLGP